MPLFNNGLRGGQTHTHIINPHAKPAWTTLHGPGKQGDS